jgi:heme oxygenase (biliverdin-IX-beta and delta-forming)
LRGHAHAHLRAETQSLHGVLDAGLNLADFANRKSYVRYLLMNWPCASIEPALEDAGVERLLPDWEQRRRRFALAADLNALGVRACPSPVHAIDADAGTILGWSYVLEGSRLGARLILQTVEASGDPDVRGASRFLRHGEGRNFWASFRAVLSQIDHDAVATANACAAATAAFKYFITARDVALRS